jgi:hypothetical protein
MVMVMVMVPYWFHVALPSTRMAGKKRTSNEFGKRN